MFVCMYAYMFYVRYFLRLCTHTLSHTYTSYVRYFSQVVHTHTHTHTYINIHVLCETFFSGWCIHTYDAFTYEPASAKSLSGA